MKRTKIWLVISGILLVVLGVLCMCKPAATLFTTAWLIGILTLATGISRLIFTFKTEAFIPNSGSRMLSSILLIIVGFIFLFNNVFLGMSLPVIFVMWVIIESIIVAICSFDFKKVNFKYWWCILLLGIAGIVLGFLGLRNPVASAKALSLLIGISITLLGVAYLVAFFGLNQFDKAVKGQVDTIKRAVGIK